MDGITPFSGEERSEIRQLAGIIFNGGSINDPLIVPFYVKWKWWFDIFSRCLGREGGDYVQLPCQGSVIDQPYRTMMILDFMRELYAIHSQERLKQQTGK